MADPQDGSASAHAASLRITCATVVPNSILDAWMPEQIGGALLFNVIYFLGGRARLAFWDRMAQVLPEGAPILMSRAYGVVDTGEELVRTASSTMGRNTYERWRQTVPVKDGRVEITNTYKTIRGGEVGRRGPPGEERRRHLVDRHVRRLR